MNSTKIIVALDFPDAVSALALVARLDPALCRLKVGKELFTDLIPLCDPCHTRQHGLPGTPASMLAFLDRMSQQVKAGIP